jgi:hypothetical protein
MLNHNTSKYHNALENNLNNFTASQSLNNNNDFILPYRSDKDKMLESKLQAKTSINLCSSTNNQYNGLPQSTTAPISSIKNSNKDIGTLNVGIVEVNRLNNKDSSYDSFMNEQSLVKLDLKQQKTDFSNAPNPTIDPNISNVLSKSKNNEQNTK